jgi:hypothetical protein
VVAPTCRRIGHVEASASSDTCDEEVVEGIEVHPCSLNHRIPEEVLLRKNSWPFSYTFSNRVGDDGTRSIEGNS